MVRSKLLLLSIAVALPPLFAQAPTVIATGLQAPQKLLLTRGGNFLVTETSLDANAGRISIVSRTGTRRSLIEGLPSGTDVVGSGSGPTAMVLDNRTLVVAIGGGDAERRGTTPGTSVYNPAGMSSPLFTSVLEFVFSMPVDMITGTFVLTADNRQALADGRSLQLSDGAGTTSLALLLTKFPEAIPDPISVYRFSNPWGLAMSESGRAIYMTDASRNTLVSIDGATGRPTTIARFPPIQNPTPVGPPFLDSVPTSVRTYEGGLLVSFLTGFPFAPGLARVLAVDPDTGETVPFIFNLTSATDVLPRRLSNGGYQFYVLEFSLNQSATPPAPGRLLRYDTEAGVPVTNELAAPVSMVIDEESKSMFILQLTGQIVQVPLG